MIFFQGRDWDHFLIIMLLVLYFHFVYFLLLSIHVVFMRNLGKWFRLLSNRWFWMDRVGSVYENRYTRWLYEFMWTLRQWFWKCMLLSKWLTFYQFIKFVLKSNTIHLFIQTMTLDVISFPMEKRILFLTIIYWSAYAQNMSVIFFSFIWTQMGVNFRYEIRPFFQN